MRQDTKEGNSITRIIIGVSGRLIVYALVVLLLVEGVTKGYAFGHGVFCPTAVDAAPGINKLVVVSDEQTKADTVRLLKSWGLIENELAVWIQMVFFEYDIYPGTYTLNTSMTSREILQILNEKPAQEGEDGAGGSL